ncbi:lipocalin family protein [Profundibacter sp.]|uniref:lipocalin family protein n=1 Tax=Profundibacter sp. TaxID=3101071 RepID=UPI003D1084AE
MFKPLLIAAFLAVPLAACVPDTGPTPPPVETQLSKEAKYFVGPWVEVLLGGSGSGFELMADGTAKAIDDPQTIYSYWRFADGRLYLTTAKTVGNAIKDTETGHRVEIIDETSFRLFTKGSDWPRVYHYNNADVKLQ